MDYYDPHPRISVDRPLVLVGHPGAGVDTIARVLCGRTGLAFNDVSRATEALAGQSRARLIVEQGVVELRRIEARALRRAIGRRPCGVVSADSAVFEDEEIRRFVADEARSVWVRRPHAVLLARIRSGVAASPGSFPDFVIGAPGTAEALEAHLATRDAALETCDVIFEAGDDHAIPIASELEASLDRLVGVNVL